MKNVLVSGSSGIIGYGILRSLKKYEKKLTLIGTTIYEDSVAQGFCDIFEKAVPTNDPNYIGWLKNIIRKHKIDLIIPGIEADVYKWVEHIPEIEETGTRIVLNNRELIALCYDKWLFYQELCKQNERYAIESSLDNDFESLSRRFGLPFLLKPRCGHGSKGIVKVINLEIFLKHKAEIGNVLMAQPIIGNDDEEFSTSAFCDGKGSYFASMTLKRKLSKDGFTEKAEVVEIPEIDDILRALCEQFKPLGPTNFQMRKQHGLLKLLEINPRVSSATSIRSSFGYNESTMAVEYYLEGNPPTQPVLRKGKAVRYIDEFVFYS